MIRTFLAALALLCFIPQHLGAQATDSLRLKPGDIIRLTGPLPTDPGWVSGRVIDVRPGGFSFSVEGNSSGIYSREYLSVDTIDVAYRNARESARGGAILGGFAGTTLGSIAGALLARHVSMETGSAVAVSAVAGGVLGALTGAVAGARISPIRWHRYVFQ